MEVGIIEAVQYSDLAAPVVPILKRDGSIRLCGDYELTVNRVAKLEYYLLTRVTTCCMASLGNGTVFTKLDLAHAYNQLALAEESKKYVTFSTQSCGLRYRHWARV